MPNEKPQPGGGAGSQNPGGETKAGETPPAVEQSWRDGLAPEIKASKSLDKFRGKDWSEVGPQVLSSYINLEKLHGGAVRIPGADAKPDEVKEFNKKLGVPETVDAYDVSGLVPEGMSWDKDREKAFLQHAIDNGMTKAQARKTLQWYIAAEQSSIDAETRSNVEGIQKGTDALNKTWGANTPRNVALIGRAAAEFGGPEFTALLDTEIPGVGKLGNHPAMNMLLWRVGEASLEHQIIPG
ncbi:MAG: hypothetical protein ACREF4_13020, partial [Gammaproteobacteria bacterium]